MFPLLRYKLSHLRLERYCWVVILELIKRNTNQEPSEYLLLEINAIFYVIITGSPWSIVPRYIYNYYYRISFRGVFTDIADKLMKKDPEKWSFTEDSKFKSAHASLKEFKIGKGITPDASFDIVRARTIDYINMRYGFEAAGRLELGKHRKKI